MPAWNPVGMHDVYGKNGCLDMKLNLNSPTGLESLHSKGLCIAALGSNQTEILAFHGLSFIFSLHSHSLNQLKYPW